MAKLSDIVTVKATNDPATYSTFIYGPVKIGKSTFVHNLYGERVLMLMTEYRERGLVGAKTVRIKSWSDFLSWMRVLNTKDAHEQFDVVAIDTVDNLWSMLNKFVADRWEESAVGERNDIFGKDWTQLKTDWTAGLQLIQRAQFTPYFVGHSQQKTIQVPLSPELAANKDALEGYTEVTKGKEKYLEFLQYQPDLPEKAMNPINKMVDQILYLSDMVNANGDSERVIHTRGNHQWIAGSTFEKIAPVVKLDADQYRQAVQDAIDNYGEDGKTDEQYLKDDTGKSFDELMDDAKKLGLKLSKAGKHDELKNIVDGVFGKDVRLVDAKPTQTELLEVAIMKMKEIA